MGKFLCNCLHHIIAAIQILLAIAIVVMVAVKLDNITGSYTWEGTTLKYESACTLGSSVDGSTSLCNYVYAVVGVSLFVSFVISVVQCFTCNLCGLGSILDLLFAGFGLAWWIIAAGVVQNNVTNASDASLPLQDWRTATVACMWTEVALFVLLVMTGVFRLCGMCI